MKSKIFISINIPEKVKKRLEMATQKWKEFPVKWTKEANLHITLVFLGFVDEDMIPGICQKVSKTSQKKELFDLEFEEIGLFPSESAPRMVALIGKASEELKNLVNSIEEELEISYAPKKSFRPHITLGRIRKHKWEDMDIVPEIKEKFSVDIAVRSIDIMASNFGEGGSEYFLIESCPLE